MMTVFGKNDILTKIAIYRNSGCCLPYLWWMLKINEHFRPPVGAVFNRTE